MALQMLDERSAPSSKSELELFTTPPTQVQVEYGYWDIINPENPVTNQGPYTFIVRGGPDFIQWDRNYLYIKFRILKRTSDGTLPLNKNDPPIAPVNLIGKTFIKQMKVYIQGKEAIDSGDLYAYRAILESELNFGEDAKKSFLQGGWYVKDTPFDKIDTPENNGFLLRSAICQNSSFVECYAKLHCDLFSSDRCLINHTEMRLEIHRNSDKFLLMNFTDDTESEYFINIEKMAFHIRKISVTPSAVLAIEKTLDKNVIKYPIRKVKLMRLHIHEGSYATPMHNLFSGQIPRRMLVCCVGSNAYYGTFKTSPFRFQNFDIKKIQITSGGHSYPRQPLECDFSNNLYTEAFMKLFENLDISNEQKANNITWQDFADGLCVFAFNLMPDGCDESHLQLVKEGSTHLDIELNKPAPSGGIEVIIYAEFENVLSFDKFRNIYYDYNA